MDLSLVIPVYNEEKNLPDLFGEIEAVFRSSALEVEVIFVDDGSTDASFDVLKAYHDQNRYVRVIRFGRNFGQTAAIAAGFDAAAGKIVVTLDSDLQNDPRDIPMLIQKLNEGFDLVSGWRRKRKDPLFSRRVPSWVANMLISRVTGVYLHDYGCTLKALRGDLVKELHLYGEMHRFIPAIASERGVRIAEVEVNHRPRIRGQSKYGMLRTLKVILDLLTVRFLLSYSTRPIQIFGLVGFVSSSLGILIGIYLSFQKYFFGATLGNRPVLLLAILLIFIGFQFITMGLLGEMLARTYHESQGKPIYVVREVLR
jgi:glycosyltransferase involved in cell wall biosynthesis